MTDSELSKEIITHLESGTYRPQRARHLARELKVQEEDYHAFRTALRELMHAGRVVLGGSGTVMLPSQVSRRDEFTGTYRHNRRGFGFVVPTDSSSHEDLFIPPGENSGAITGDIVRAKITSRGERDGKAIHSGRITEIIERTQKRFVGTLAKQGGDWMVLPDGNALTEAILTPDAATRYLKVGTKVVVEMTTYAENGARATGVISEVLGEHGAKDVDLKSVIVQFNLPGEFPEAVRDAARAAIDSFDPEAERANRLDLSDFVVCTIDPEDAKDYDDAISLRRLENGNWQLGVHIADVSHFVKTGSPLDEEARTRGNSTYFPGFVIPMLPEVLSNGVCSLQEGVPRLCKSAFIEYDADARPVATKFANTIIHSAKRLRYREAQAIIDRAQEIPHPDGARNIGNYAQPVIDLLDNMNTLARQLHARRREQGQIVLDLPQVQLKLDEEGKVIAAEAEDDSFTHTLIEMFMVEANEAVARLLDSLNVPFLRRVHPEPAMEAAAKLRHFVGVAGHPIPKVLDRKAIQKLLASVKGKPESFAVSLAVLKSLTRAEYSPEVIGHYALASEHYCHFTSPIRRYADLTIHRLLDAFFAARADAEHKQRRDRKKLVLEDIPSEQDLVELGEHISYTERRSEDAERELRSVKLLTLMGQHIGDEFTGVVTGIAKFGIFVQLNTYLVDGIIRYEDLMDDWWSVDERGGFVRGERTGKRIGIGDAVKVVIVKVDLARRELSVAIRELLGRPGGPAAAVLNAARPGGSGKGPQKKGDKAKAGKNRRPANARGGGPARGGSPRRGGGPARGGGPSRAPKKRR